jgi:hypothetical protein
MKYIDQACVWLIFVAGVAHISTTELLHPPRAVLDTGLLWIFLAMFNLLRIRNGYGIHRLRTFCIGANAAVLALECVRWRMFGLSNLVVVVLVLCETLFSIRQKQSETSKLSPTLPPTGR